MSGGLFVPSGARVPLVGLPPIDRPLRLPDGRKLRFDTVISAPTGAHGQIQRAQIWLGPEGMQCLAGLDQTDAWGPLLHVSTSYAGQKRRPSWEDYVHGVPVCPNSEVFHLWQIPQRWGIR